MGFTKQEVMALALDIECAATVQELASLNDRVNKCLLADAYTAGLALPQDGVLTWYETFEKLQQDSILDLHENVSRALYFIPANYWLQSCGESRKFMSITRQRGYVFHGFYCKLRRLDSLVQVGVSATSCTLAGAIIAAVLMARLDSGIYNGKS